MCCVNLGTIREENETNENHFLFFYEKLIQSNLIQSLDTLLLNYMIQMRGIRRSLPGCCNVTCKSHVTLQTISPKSSLSFSCSHRLEFLFLHKPIPPIRSDPPSRPTAVITHKNPKIPSHVCMPFFPSFLPSFRPSFDSIPPVEPSILYHKIISHRMSS